MTDLERDMIGQQLHRSYARYLMDWSIAEVRPAIARLIDGGASFDAIVGDIVTVLHEEADSFGAALRQTLSS